MRILIVEDNVVYSHLTAERLARAGFDSDEVATAEAALKAVASVDYSAVVLDLGLPDEDGIDLLQKIRKRSSVVPIIVTTARNGLNDRVLGLQSGADDYLTKPFSSEELVARLHALLRRHHPPESNILCAGNVALDVDNRTLRIGGDIQVVRERELELLELLMRNPGRVVKRDALADLIFGKHGRQGAASIDVYLHRLRKVLDDAHATVRIDNIRGLGFLMSEGNERGS
jgi:DNA-binding response OmpR family regulator